MCKFEALPRNPPLSIGVAVAQEGREKEQDTYKKYCYFEQRSFLRGEEKGQKSGTLIFFFFNSQTLPGTARASWKKGEEDKTLLFYFCFVSTSGSQGLLPFDPEYFGGKWGISEEKAFTDKMIFSQLSFI